MRPYLRRTIALTTLLLVLVGLRSATPRAWGVQGHRVFALVASANLTTDARASVRRLLPDETLADVANWADQYISGNTQTAPWHYVNIPSDAGAYDRDRDCPRQPGVSAGSVNDRWRDCIVDRILYHQERLGNRSLDRADRAIALKFLVHFVGDLHQPFHAIDVARGGNDIPVVAFGSSDCRRSDGTTFPCNLHGIWDTQLIARRALSDQQYVTALSDRIARHRRDASTNSSTPATWALESLTLARTALLPRHGVVDEAYYRAQIAVIDDRLALGGLRLAAMINTSLR